MMSASKLRRRLGIVAGLVVLYTVTGFWILPPLIKSRLEQRAGAALGRRVTVERVRLNPFALSLTLEKFAIYEKDGVAPFLTWRTLYTNFDALASFGGAWVLSDILLDGFDLRVVVHPDRSGNASDLLEKFSRPGPAASEPGRPLRIGRLRVSDARVDFTDQSRPQPFATTLGPVTFAVSDFHTGGQKGDGAPYEFSATTELGTRLAWSGTVQAKPLGSLGKFAIENIHLPKFAPYYDEHTRADLLEGKLSVSGRYEVALGTAPWTIKLVEASAHVRGLKIIERESKQSAVELPALDIAGLNGELFTQTATIESVILAGGRLRVQRDQRGALNLLTMLQPLDGAPAPSTAPATAPTAGGPAPTPPAKRPNIKIGQLALKDFQIDATDLSTPQPMKLQVSAIDLSLRNLSTERGAQMPLQLAFASGPGGTVRLEGEVGIAPLNADLKTTVAGLALLPFSPYLEQFVNARISQGEVSATLSTQILMTDQDKVAAVAAGEVKVEKFGLVDTAQEGELLGFDQLTLQGLRASGSASQDVTVDEIAVVGPRTRIVLNRDRSLNLLALARATTPAVTPATSPAPDAPVAAPKIQIGKVVISDGEYRFTDLSVEPNVTMELSRFAGTIAGLSSTNPAKGTVELTGAVDGTGPISISGRLDPLGPEKSVDLQVDFKNVDLVPLSPYSGKYAGYELARGQLLLDVKVRVEGKKVDMTNVITLNQFTFGSPVKSPDATGLPVRLGVALLKDSAGQIVIDVPVQGRTDDPQFRVSRVVLRVIGNLLTKAATSPFSLLGAAFGGGGEELAYQEFQPGSAALQPAEVKKLQTMIQALKNRPALSVSLEGSYDPAADAYGLKRAKLDEKVRRRIWEEKRAKDPNLAPPASLVVTPEESVAMIKQLFDAQFPPGTSFGAPIPEPPKPVAPPPKPTGFFARLIDAITQKSKREARAAEAENARLATEHQEAVAAAVARGLPYEEMRHRLAETMTVDDNDLRALAQARARQVQDYFTTTGGIAADRLFLAKDSSEAAKPGKGPRVFLGLQ